MILKTLSNRKIINFHNVKVSTKLWKIKIWLPCITACNERVEIEKKLVWVIRLVLN